MSARGAEAGGAGGDVTGTRAGVAADGARTGAIPGVSVEVGVGVDGNANGTGVGVGGASNEGAGAREGAIMGVLAEGTGAPTGPGANTSLGSNTAPMEKTATGGLSYSVLVTEVFTKPVEMATFAATAVILSVKLLDVEGVARVFETGLESFSSVPRGAYAVRTWYCNKATFCAAVRLASAPEGRAANASSEGANRTRPVPVSRVARAAPTPVDSKRLRSVVKWSALVSMSVRLAVAGGAVVRPSGTTTPFTWKNV